jgi:hypothetical protein
MRQQLKFARHSLLVRSLLVWLALSLATAALANSGGSGRYLWKSIPAAQIKIDDKTPLAWNIFQTGQKKEGNLVLVLLGRRYIALDIKAKMAYTVLPADVQPRGAELESGDLFVQAKILPTENWSLRDVGMAELIKLKLNDYGTTLQIQLPHPPDLRGLY